MQNDFGSPCGMFDRAGIDLSAFRRAVGPTAGVLTSARDAGIKVVYLKMAFRPDLSDIGPPGAPNRERHLQVFHDANDALSAIHSRMPAILSRDLEEAWLDRDNADVEKLLSMLQPYPAEGMTAYPVSRLVNNTVNEGRELIAAQYARMAA